MGKITRQTDGATLASSEIVAFEQLDEFARSGIQRLLQQVLEEEVEAMLGCSRSERREADAPLGYRNGHGKEHRLSTRSLTARGMNCPHLVMGYGHLGIWSALANVYPDAQEQRCWNHRLRNVLDRVGKKRQGAAKELLSKVMYAETRKEAEAAKRVFQA